MKKILIIEDDPAIMIGMEQLFSSENYSVLKSERGDSGLNLALEEFPDLIILDINRVFSTEELALVQGLTDFDPEDA